MKKIKNSGARLYIFYIKDEGEGAWKRPEGLQFGMPDLGLI